MYSRLIWLLLALGLALTGVSVVQQTAVSAAQFAPTPLQPTDGPWPDPVPGGLYTSRRSDGVISLINMSIFGPHICTSFGDPYSPLNSVWAPGYYTYTYRIRIPADYPYDIVRIELFDPDSLNTPINSVIITHTDLAIAHGLPITESMTCSTSQRDPCVLLTGESLLGLPIDQINPYWYVRVDENRGAGAGNGNGTCGVPANYTPAYNTKTRYQLYYYAGTPGNEEPMPLATYNGQVNDGLRDIGDHQTDLHWVAPGSQMAYDQPVNVPTECGSPNGGDYDPLGCPVGTPAGPGSGFEVSLSQDVPGLVADPFTGDRFLYLGITALSGASENDFDIWAGPAIYTTTTASNVNLRNVQILNQTPHDSQGVTVLAASSLPRNSYSGLRQEFPLAYIGPEYAGQTISLTLFDIDSGYAPPIHFFFDSIPTADWRYTFSNGGIDPDGVVATLRCSSTSCNNQWISPSLTIRIPGDQTCDYTNFDPAYRRDFCTPFYGGRLMTNIQHGVSDTFLWQVRLPDEPQTHTSCSAFPIAVNALARSVTPPGMGANPFPDGSEFDYPPSPPTYHNFYDHVPDVSLDQAQVGYVYRLFVGSGAGQFDWLRWNSGITATAQTLANSLTWPGDTLDFANYGDGGVPATWLYPYVVRGFVSPLDSSDVMLQTGDGLLAFRGDADALPVRTALNPHIDGPRTLRLPVWRWQEGSRGMYWAAQFALFRLAGYHLGADGSWLLLEFRGWNDTECQGVTAVSALTLQGPDTGRRNVPYEFTAVASPGTALLPLVYTWQATGQVSHTYTVGLTSTLSFSWPMAGVYVVSVTAENVAGAVTAVHPIIIFPQSLPLFTLYVPVLWRP